MKIDNTGKPLNSSIKPSEARTPARSQSSEQTAAPAPQRGSVDLKSFGAHLQSLEQSLASQPVIDEAKVAEIRQAIKEGRFTIRADAIADKLMASVKELLGNKKD